MIPLVAVATSPPALRSDAAGRQGLRAEAGGPGFGAAARMLAAGRAWTGRTGRARRRLARTAPQPRFRGAVEQFLRGLSVSTDGARGACCPPRSDL